MTVRGQKQTGTVQRRDPFCKPLPSSMSLLEQAVGDACSILCLICILLPGFLPSMKFAPALLSTPVSSCRGLSRAPLAVRAAGPASARSLLAARLPEARPGLDGSPQLCSAARMPVRSRLGAGAGRDGAGGGA